VNDASALLKSVNALARELQGLQAAAVAEYTPVVETLIATGSRDVRQIEWTLDGLLDFCGHSPVLDLYRRLCRHYFDIDPVATASYVNAYREMWGADEEMVGAGLKPAPTGPRRKNLRLRGYDYTQVGFYFVTICVQDRVCLFGEINDGVMQLNSLGALVEQAWQDLPNHYPHVELDQFVIMPNHIHGIIVLTVGAGFKPAQSSDTTPAPTKRHGLPEIVRAFKSFSARRINEIRQTPGISVWQRNYYEHIIRDDADYQRIAEYVMNNPAKWQEDSLHPEYVAKPPPHAQNTDNGNVGAGFKPAPAMDTKGSGDE
jgi:REP element-mobilizing transposase RayT